jgi:hypothetical protein
MKKDGHISDHMSLNAIAKKHNVTDSELRSELKKGIKVEKEHTNSNTKAARIALDHLFEDPKYYTKLNKLHLENIKVKLYPGGLGADVDYDEEEFNQLPTKTISLDQLVLNEPASKMKQPKSKATLKRFIKSIKSGETIPPIIVRKLGDKYQILDGHHRYFAFKLLNKDNIKAIIVDSKDIEILKENLNKDLVKEFMKHVISELDLDKLPSIKLSNNSQDAVNMRSWGGYRPGDKSINITIAKRHPADIFRTLAHELVHYKQDIDGRLKPGDGETGSDIENEANSKAAVIMRNFAQAKPSLFEHLITELGNDLNAALPFEYVGGKDNEYTFKTDKNEYKVAFKQDGESTYERVYHTTNRSLGSNYDDTQEGKPIQINATVMAITLDFMKRNPEFYIIYIVPLDSRRFNIVYKFVQNNLPKQYSFQAESTGKENVLVIYNQPTPPGGYTN